MTIEVVISVKNFYNSQIELLALKIIRKVTVKII